MNEVDLTNVLISEMTALQLFSGLTAWALLMCMLALGVWLIFRFYEAQFGILENIWRKFGKQQATYFTLLMTGIGFSVIGLGVVLPTTFTLILGLIYVLCPVVVTAFVWLPLILKFKVKPLPEVASN